jgi:hypothetical protein
MEVTGFFPLFPHSSLLREGMQIAGDEADANASAMHEIMAIGGLLSRYVSLQKILC